MGVMDALFGKSSGEGTPSTALAPSQIGPSGPTVSSPAPAPAATPAVAGTPAAAPAVPDSPLDIFKDIWHTAVDAEGKPIQAQPNPLESPVFNFDPAKISAQAKTLDFVKDIKPELLEGLVANGALDTGKLLELINSVQQNAFTAATLSLGNMVNQGISSNNAKLKSTLPSLMRGVTLDDTPVGDNPVFEHPAVQPLVKALRQAEFAKNANANPADVAKKINDYLTGLAAAVAENQPEAVAARQQVAARKTNWEEYMGTGH